MPDAHKNFAYSQVATAPSPAVSGTSLVVTAAQGALFPTAPFNATIWPTGVSPTAANAEIVRVTNISTDTLTITRSQEGTSARTVIVGDQIAASITNKTLTDIEGDVLTKQPLLLTTNAQSGTTYTLVLGDANNIVELSNAAAITLTLPLNSSVAYAVGTSITLIQTGAGQVTVANGGTTLNGSPGLKLNGQWAAATLLKRATDTWVIFGNLTA
jgi:hypothetical protein